MPGYGTRGATRRQDGRLSDVSEDPGILEDPRILLESILEGKDPDGAIAGLVDRLARPGYSISDLLGDVTRLKEKIAKEQLVTSESTAERLIDGWRLLDQAVGECLARTTASHEKFLENTLHAFCHYDRAGIIVSANNKMLDLIPDCVGRSVATIFGKMAGEVRLALAGGPHRLYELELPAKSGQLPVLAEFGTIDTVAHDGGYALLVDMSDLVGAERKALESAPNGMLKLDAKHRIRYATEKALDLFELSREELIGRDARRFITDKESLTEVIRQGLRRRKGLGDEYDVLFTKPKSGKQIPLRVTSVPCFDAAGAFSGSITGLQPIDYIVARETIARLIGTEPDYRRLYDRIVEIIKGFAEFDWANLFVYSPARDYSRIVLSHGPAIEYQSRWFPTPDGYIDWLDQPHTWMGDLEKDVASGPAPEYLERTDMKQAVRAGMKALVCLPIRSGGRIIGGFCLASKRPGIYGAETREILEHLLLEQAFLPLLNSIETAEREFVNGLVKQIANSEDMQQVAETVVNELSEFYQFQNVSIFKVNALRGHVRLLAQALLEGGTAMQEGYTQSIERGMLGLCYRRGDCAILKDFQDNSEEAKVYVRVAPEVRSELCIPIRLFHRVLWILNLEDRLSDAFTPIEVEKLQRVIQQMQTTLERIFQNLVLVQVLDVCPAAIVLTDQKFNILRCNKEARQMLQRNSVSPEDNFARFFRQSPADFSADATMTTVVGAEGGEVPVLASRFTLDEEYDHVVFMLQDVTELQWTARFETLRAALAETTAQVRVPVSLLSSFVRRIGQKVEDEKLQDLTRKAMRQLGRIELTYDRVLASYQAQSLPAKRDVPFDVKLALEHILSELPDLERRAVRLFDKSRGAVRADPYRVLFALNSMLAYLLRSRSNDEPIVIKVERPDDVVQVSMTGAVQASQTVGELAALVEATRAEIALGRDVLVRIASEAGGSFELERRPNGREWLCLRMAALS
jgi:PAS domain S-box-containing protein